MTNKMRDLVVSIVKSEAQKYKSVEWSVLYGEDQKLTSIDFNEDFDGRLLDSYYVQNSITIIGNAKQGQEIIGKSTLFFIERDVYRSICVWKLNSKEKTLEKFFLSQHPEFTNETCVVLGYTQTANSEKNNFSILYHACNYFLNVIKKVTELNEILLLVEPCGIVQIPQEAAACSSMKLSEPYSLSVLGKVDRRSLTSEKFVKKLGFCRMTDCYHLSTLGPIYYFTHKEI